MHGGNGVGGAVALLGPGCGRREVERSIRRDGGGRKNRHWHLTRRRELCCDGLGRVTEDEVLSMWDPRYSPGQRKGVWKAHSSGVGGRLWPPSQKLILG